MTAALKPLARPASLHRSVQDAIRAFILDNTLRAGDALPPETDLARQLGVSRNSVREAVKAMESLGILETRRGSGLYVRAFSFAPLLENLSYGLLFDLRELAELLDIRRVLETGLIAAAMAAMPPAALAALGRVVAEMGARADQGENFPDEDRRFHQVLFEPLGNRTLLTLLDVFWLTYREATRHVDMGNPDPVLTYRDHAAIHAAVAAADVEGARAALDQHYAWIARRLELAQAQLRPDEEGPPGAAPVAG
ncbi:MAG: FadR family transcriptional regulator [Chloroflexia bacterium]|nr:FadR family transcriptional regulator [Chloroflexia bacterium]